LASFILITGTLYNAEKDAAEKEFAGLGYTKSLIKHTDGSPDRPNVVHYLLDLKNRYRTADSLRYTGLSIYSEFQKRGRFGYG
jgi:hypothetical protein